MYQFFGSNKTVTTSSWIGLPQGPLPLKKNYRYLSLSFPNGLKCTTGLIQLIFKVLYLRRIVN